MRKHTRHLAHAAIIAALYAVLTHFQNILLPGTATWAIQMRLSEALCVLAFFTPAAIPGLAAGCLIFNLSFAGALPTDWLVGSLATFAAAWAMYRLRQVRMIGLPVPGLLMPALSNAILVGWELTVYIGGGFWLNALYVAIGEALIYSRLRGDYCNILSRYSYGDIKPLLEQVQTADMVRHEALAEQVFATTYDNGCRMIVNYSDVAYTVGETTVEPMGFALIKDGEPVEE